MTTNLTYTSLSITRTNMSRRPEDWLTQSMARGPIVVPVYGSQNLIRGTSDPHGVLIDGQQAHDLLEEGGIAVLLGTDDDRPVFALGLDEDRAVAVETAAGAEAQFMDIRAVGPLLPAKEAQIMAHARGMVHWHRRHGFCGVCGTKTISRHNGHERHCISPDCGASHFPRTDPAVIVLVSRDDAQAGPGGKCLMGRNPRWPFPMFSTLAGFVEPGETLEQTVYREILEESGIETTDIVYMASQPWPFPQSLMLGFRARATTYDIEIDTDELSDCQWFSRDEVHAMKEFRDAKEDEVRLPRSDSISRWLIQSWLDDI